MVHAVLESLAFKQAFVVCATVGGTGVNRRIAVAPIEQLLETLGVMHVGGGHVVAADELVFGEFLKVPFIHFIAFLFHYFFFPTSPAKNFANGLMSLSTLADSKAAI